MNGYLSCLRCFSNLFNCKKRPSECNLDLQTLFQSKLEQVKLISNYHSENIMSIRELKT